MIRALRRRTSATSTGSPDRRSPVSSQSSQKSGREGGSPLDFLLILLLSLVFMFGVVRPFVAEPFAIPSESMAPTLEAGDKVLASKFAYRLSEPRRGDIVVFAASENSNEPTIKRVVALPGDTVAIKHGALFVNGERKKEPYVDYRLTDANFFGPMQVPEGSFFVMGDNRANSRDSRWFGPVPEKDLLGKVLLRLWPPNRVMYF